MEFEGLKTTSFYIKLGYVTLVASIITMIITQVIKVILSKKGIINKNMNSSRKDMLLSGIGRVVALLVYTCLYLLNEFLLKHLITFDENLIVGLLSGGALTLTVAKGLYTALHQLSQKKNVFERLEYAEELNRALEEVISKQSNDEAIDNLTNDINLQKKNASNRRWKLTNKK